MREFKVVFTPNDLDSLSDECSRSMTVSAVSSDVALEIARSSPPPEVQKWGKPYGVSLCDTPSLQEENTERCIAMAARTVDPFVKRIDLLDPRFCDGEQCLVLFLKGDYRMVRMHRRLSDPQRWDICMSMYSIPFVPPSEPGCKIVAMWRVGFEL